MCSFVSVLTHQSGIGNRCCCASQKTCPTPKPEACPRGRDASSKRGEPPHFCFCAVRMRDIVDFVSACIALARLQQPIGKSIPICHQIKKWLRPYPPQGCDTSVFCKQNFVSVSERTLVLSRPTKVHYDHWAVISRWVLVFLRTVGLLFYLFCFQCIEVRYLALFQNSLSDLMGKLLDAQPHFVRLVPHFFFL